MAGLNFFAHEVIFHSVKGFLEVSCPVMEAEKNYNPFYYLGVISWCLSYRLTS